MRHFLIANFLTIVLLFLSSCIKKEFTKPSELTFYFNFEGESDDIDYARFIKGQIIIEEFEFQGVREGAPDFFFEKKYEKGIVIEWPNSSAELSFEIPQGLYTSIEISVTLSSDHEKALVAEGVYDRLDNHTVPFTFELDEEIQFEINAENEVGDPIIELSNNRVNQARIFFRVADMVNKIKRDSLEVASDRAIPLDLEEPGDSDQPPSEEPEEEQNPEEQDPAEQDPAEQEDPVEQEEPINEKITICHIPPGKPENKVTLDVSESALQAHLDHGDTIGSCTDEGMEGGRRNTNHQDPSDIEVKNEILISKERNEGFLDDIKDEISNNIRVIFQDP